MSQTIPEAQYNAFLGKGVWAADVSGGAQDFSGANVTDANQALLSIWVKWEADINVTTNFLRFDGASSGGCTYSIDPDGYVIVEFSDAAGTPTDFDTSDVPLPVGTWCHIYEAHSAFANFNLWFQTVGEAERQVDTGKSASANAGDMGVGTGMLYGNSASEGFPKTKFGQMWFDLAHNSIIADSEDYRRLFSSVDGRPTFLSIVGYCGLAVDPVLWAPDGEHLQYANMSPASGNTRPFRVEGPPRA